MILRQDSDPPGWLDWLATEIGTRQWCVATRLTDRLRQTGYDLALSSKRYDALRNKWLAQTTARLMFGVAP